MIELGRHIEILLLSNDCVIVPGLGGFMTHHVNASYDSDEQLFLPPIRTLGFNPQLKVNDSLLALSYTEAYDISYPEALRRIEDEVNELRQNLDNVGYYDFCDIGKLEVNAEGNLLFHPCEAGILTPELYGLSSFSMSPLKNSSNRILASQPAKAVPDEEPAPAEAIDDEVKESDIVIKMSWIRNIAATAAAILLFFLLTPPVANSLSDNTNKNVQAEVTLIPTGKSTAKKPIKISQQEADSSAKVSEQKDLKPTPTTPSEATTDKTAPHPASITDDCNYCIVLASQVTQHNAETFVSQLQAKGISSARVFVNNNIVRVVCGSFKTQNEAYRQLRIVSQQSGLEDAWVYRMKN